MPSTLGLPDSTKSYNWLAMLEKWNCYEILTFVCLLWWMCMIWQRWIYYASRPAERSEVGRGVFYFSPHSDLYHVTLGSFLRLLCTRRYSPLRGLTSSSCGGLRPRLFLPFGQKRAYYAVLAHFWQFLVSSSNLGNF